MNLFLDKHHLQNIILTLLKNGKQQKNKIIYSHHRLMKDSNNTCKMIIDNKEINLT